MKTMKYWLSNISRRGARTASISSLFCAGLMAVMSVALAAPLAVEAGQTDRQESQPQQKEPIKTTNDRGAETSSPTVSGIHLPSDEEYRIGANDVIDIQVDNAPELSGSFRVSASGTFLMRYLGRIEAINKTTDELIEIITNGLRGKYLKDPSVRVAVLQYNSRAFFIQGAVNKPGVYQIDGRPTLLELFTIAGGLAADHGSTAFIIRKIKLQQGAEAAESAQSEPQSAPNGTPADESLAKYELFKSNISGLLKGNFSNNVPIEPGDIVNVPPTDIFFVAGEVNAPGQFPLKDRTTLRQAISLAQGMTFTASSNGTIFRENPVTGERFEIKVDVGAIMKGKKQDVAIQANDVIMITNSRLKSVSRTLLSGFGFGALRFPGIPRY